MNETYFAQPKLQSGAYDSHPGLSVLNRLSGAAVKLDPTERCVTGRIVGI